MPTLPLRRLGPLLAIALCAAPVLAQRADVNAALDTIRRAHREREIVQRVEVTVASRGEQRTEALLVHTHPPHTLRVSVGPVLLWTDSGFLYAVHRDDGRALLKRPIDARGPLPLIDELFPPLPLPQLALAFGPDNAVLNPTAYTRNMAWSLAEPNAEHPISLAGAGDRCTAVMQADASGVVTALIAQLDEGAVVVNIRAAPAEAADFPAIDPPADRRVIVDSPREFISRAGAVAVGDQLPALNLTPRVMPGSPPNLSPPAAILFFRQWTREVATAHRALRAAASSIDGFRYALVMVFDPVAARPDLQMNEAASETEPDDIFHTTSPLQTVQRFADADSVLVVTDRQNTVRAIADLAPLLGREASEQNIFELNAKPNEQAAQRLLEQIKSATEAR